MATCWKVYAPTNKAEKGAPLAAASGRWEDTEIIELEKLARKATETARQSMQHINADKAEACRKQLLKEMKEAR